MLPQQRLTSCTAVLAGFLIFAAPAARGQGPVSDNFYRDNHPKLFFDEKTVGDVRDKVEDGERDAEAYAFIRLMVDNIYPIWSMPALLWDDFGTTAIPNLGLGVFIPDKEDDAARLLGRDLTLHIVDAYDVDFNEANSAFRLRALALGYDMFFLETPDSTRQRVRDEMVSYMQLMTNSFPYLLFTYRPYLANHSAMVAGALGLAAVCLDGEVDPVLVGEAMQRADTIVDSLLTYQFDDGGSYNEGSLYAAWSMRHLIYYFHARENWDGFRYADHPKIRAMERWLAYELLPEGQARVNNINDVSHSNFPLSLNNTYFDWAQSEWNSGLSAWIWQHTSGAYGVPMGHGADQVAIVLWNRDLPPQQPGDILPPSELWVERGLYSYRSGWQSLASSEDVVFTFYSGKFHGGHAQEDQNQFTLYGYGGRFAVDNGPGSTAKQSEAHSIVLIDGAGQHNAGSSIGTDGRISEFVMNGFADYVQGDATSAYTTHSAFNNPDHPFPGIDWSWGYHGANPVDHALRNVVAVHDDGTPPYFIIMDDIDKNGLPHTYEWRLHTSNLNTIDTTSTPIRIANGSSYLDLYPAGGFGSGVITITPFDNVTADPDTDVLSFRRVAVNPYFAFILIPGDGGAPPPEVSRAVYAWGSASVIEWPGGTIDCFVHNPEGRLVTLDPERIRSQHSHRDPFQEPRGVSSADGAPLQTDAVFALIRYDSNGTRRYIASNLSRLFMDNIDWVRILDGTASCASDGATIDLDRADADFVFYGPGVTQVEHRDQALPFTRVNGFIASSTPAPGEPGPAAQGLKVTVAPNPFNPVTRLTLELERNAMVKATIYDVQGRLVTRLLDGPMAAGRHVTEWNATTGSGLPVSSGVYFLRIDTGHQTRTLKLLVLK